jgi:hypothetical protein
MTVPLIDQALAYFVETANREGLTDDGPWLTVTTDGLVLTGQLIDSQAYFEHLATLAEAAHVVFPHAAERFAAWGKQAHLAMQTRVRLRDEAIARLPEHEALSPEQLEEFAPNYIHLRHVTVLAGGQATALPAWRGRLSELTGWTVGAPGERVGSA